MPAMRDISFDKVAVVLRSFRLERERQKDFANTRANSETRTI